MTERVIPGPAGAPGVPLLICSPTATSIPTGAIYYVHGGGMVIGDNRLGMADMIDLAQELSCAVISVDYRLAPESPHPAPFDDCYAGLVWTAEHARKLGIDPDQVVVAGVSDAGGVAELHVWPGGFHGFDILAPHAQLSQDARAARARWLRRIFEA